jgi:hypothetical protein
VHAEPAAPRPDRATAPPLPEPLPLHPVRRQDRGMATTRYHAAHCIPYHAEFRGMRSSLAGPSVLGHSGQFLLRMIRCSNQIASRNSSGDSLKRAITSALVKRELSKSSSSRPVGQTRRACQDHAEYTTRTAPRKRRAETLLRVDPFPTPHAPELRMIRRKRAI